MNNLVQWLFNLYVYFKKILILFYKFLYKLLKPKSQDDDSKRREFILNVILFASIVLVSVALIVIVIFGVLVLGGSYKGVSPWVPVIVLFSLLTLYFLSRKGFFISSSFIILGLLFISNFHTAFKWELIFPRVC